jgi:hypothetical protein
MLNALLNSNSDYETAVRNYEAGVKYRLYQNDTERDLARSK